MLFWAEWIPQSHNRRIVLLSNLSINSGLEYHRHLRRRLEITLRQDGQRDAPTGNEPSLTTSITMSRETEYVAALFSSPGPLKSPPAALRQSI